LNEAIVMNRFSHRILPPCEGMMGRNPLNRVA
jgi:hypothetical protein